MYFSALALCELFQSIGEIIVQSGSVKIYF